MLYGSKYWKEIINFEALVRHGTIAEQDLNLFQYADDPETALAMLQDKLTKYFLEPEKPLPEPSPKRRRSPSRACEARTSNPVGNSSASRRRPSAFWCCIYFALLLFAPASGFTTFLQIVTMLLALWILLRLGAPACGKPFGGCAIA